MLESVYQAKLIKKLHAEFPGCIVLKYDTDYIQGFPDLTVLYKSRWAVLEVKASASETAEATAKLDHTIDGLHDKKIKISAETGEADDKSKKLQIQLQIPHK